MIAKVMIALAVMLLGSGPALAQDRAPQDQAAQGQAAQGQAQDVKAVLAQLAQDVMAAQQVGYLAAGKNMQVDYALLGDQVALMSAHINRELDRVVNDTGINVPRAMNEQAQARFERMAELNQEEFAREFVAFIDEIYPRMIVGIEALSRQVPESAGIAVLANEAIPALRDQIGAAEQLAQAGELDEELRAELNRGPIQRKDDPQVIPDTTPPIGEDERQ